MASYAQGFGLNTALKVANLNGEKKIVAFLQCCAFIWWLLLFVIYGDLRVAKRLALIGINNKKKEKGYRNTCILEAGELSKKIIGWAA